MNKTNNEMNRRQFLKTAAMGVAATALAPALTARADTTSAMPYDIPASRSTGRGRSAFTMWQLGTQNDLIGNTYVFFTDGGRLCVMDGGYREDENYLRGFLTAMGGKVDSWFVTHPHIDHMGSLLSILTNPRGISVGRIYHSRFNERLIASRKVDERHCRDFYDALDSAKGVEVIDVQEAGYEGKVDGMHFKFFTTADDSYTHNQYNNNSMITRIWDKRKSITFLGDMGEEEAQKLWASPYARELHCDYLQMAHHGQWACKRWFYEAVKYKACLWSTPRKLWDNVGKDGPGTGIYEVPVTKRWTDEIGITEHHVSWMGPWRLD